MSFKIPGENNLTNSTRLIKLPVMNTLTDYRLQTIGGVVMLLLGFMIWAFSGSILNQGPEVAISARDLIPVKAL